MNTVHGSLICRGRCIEMLLQASIMLRDDKATKAVVENAMTLAATAVSLRSVLLKPFEEPEK